MRGAPHGGGEQVRDGGIIPAYAGSTSRYILKPKLTRDHPRVCGEHFDFNITGHSCMGSSPRMRGALVPRDYHEPHGGIIPAYAGSTELVLITQGWGWDHPRVCGEHLVVVLLLRPTGSSPRMRGAPLERLKASAARGIIPAYAGSTYFWYEHGRKCRDHPRVCGEHRGFLALGAGFQGSSPRMRGARWSIVAGGR